MTALRRSRPPWPRGRYAECRRGYRPQRRAGVAGAERYRAENWSRSLASLAEEELAKRPGFRSFRCQQSSLLAFEFEGIHHSDLVTLLAESGIALRAGQHCAQPLLAALGVSGTLRASFAPTIPKTMLRRWSTRWIAPWKFWWINDNSAPLRHNHYRRYAAPDLRPAEPVGG